MTKFCKCEDPNIQNIGGSNKITSVICWKCLTRKFGETGKERIFTQAEWVEHSSRRGTEA